MKCMLIFMILIPRQPVATVDLPLRYSSELKATRNQESVQEKRFKLALKEELILLRRASRAKRWDTVLEVRARISQQLVSMDIAPKNIERLDGIPELWDVWFDMRNTKAPFTATEMIEIHKKSASATRKFCYYYLPTTSTLDSEFLELLNIPVGARQLSDIDSRIAAVKALARLTPTTQERQQLILGNLGVFATEDKSKLIRELAFSLAIGIASEPLRKTSNDNVARVLETVNKEIRPATSMCGKTRSRRVGSAKPDR